VAPEQVERKLAAILVADIAGYSRLAGSDEERTLARLRALRSDLLGHLPALTIVRIMLFLRTSSTLGRPSE
jgi:class 3 adenylate cyclase